MSLIKSNTAGLGGAGSPGGALGSFYSHTINQSVRLDSSSGAHFVNAAASPTATNRKKVTISCWVKRATLGAAVHTIFHGGAAGLMMQLGPTGADEIYLYESPWQIYKDALLIRDTSAWYHFVLILDTTQSTDSDRAKLYINGQLEDFSTWQVGAGANRYPALNYEFNWHTGTTQVIGSTGSTDDLAGYIAEFISIDGQDTSISDFGETKDGVWIPKDVSGLTLGNAGFYLPFSQDRTVSASAFFSDAGNSYVKFSNASHYDIGSSDDFTIEFFMWPTVKQLGENAYIFGYYGGTSGPYLSIQLIESGTPRFYLYYGNGQVYDFTYSAGAVDAGRWHHVVVNRVSGTLEMFLDGTRIGSTTVAYDGYLSNVRMVVGSAVYSAGSSITVPTSPLTAITNTQLLALTTTTLTADASSNSVTGTLHGSGYFATDGLSPFPNAAFNEDAGSNGIDFSANNIFDYDVVPDSPTNNFATLNPLDKTIGTPTISAGNLKISSSGSGYDGTYATIAVTSGKWYAEFLYISGDNRGFFGIAREERLSYVNSGSYLGNILDTYGLDFRARAYTGTNATSSSGVQLFDQTNFDTGDIGLLCFDVDAGKLWFGRRDVSGSTTIWYDSSGNNNGDPSAGSNPTYTFTATGSTWFIGCHDYAGTELMANFGQDGSFAGNITSQGASDANGIGDFNYIESGFLALCTSNLTTPAIGPDQSSLAEDFFNTVLYTGDSDNDVTVTNTFAADWVWLKIRESSSGTTQHFLQDTVRGFGASKSLSSSSDGSEGYTGSYQSSQNIVTTNSSLQIVSQDFAENGKTYVAWTWKAGGAPTADNSAAANAEPTAGSAKIDGSNRSGAFSGPPSIAIKRLSASTTAGFSIVTWTGTGSAGTIPHGLGAVPHFYVVKNLDDNSTNWQAYHRKIASDAETDYIYLNGTAAADDSDDWNDTAPTANVFSVKSHNQVNESGDDYIAYLFAPIEGYSKFGSYIGNNDADGTFVHTGFRPAWLMVRRSSGSGGWHMFDNKRSTFNEIDVRIEAQDTGAENTSGPPHMDFLSNGFKMRTTFDNMNASGDTYIYLAFAEDPFKFANAR
jgi:hypothetical protein